MSDSGGDDDSRRMWVWAAGIVAVSVVALVVGSQVARSADQDVDWYTGFGQWLGAIASLLAAGAALWIATSDRRRADRRSTADRIRAESEEEVRLARVASLVRVSYDEYVPGWGEAVGIQIENLRQDVIVDVEIAKYIIDGHNWATTDDWLSAHVRRIPKTAEGVPKPLDGVIPPNSLVIRRAAAVPESDPKYIPKDLPSLVEITYLDSSGLRWRADSQGHIERIPDRHDEEA